MSDGMIDDADRIAITGQSGDTESDPGGGESVSVYQGSTGGPATGIDPGDIVAAPGDAPPVGTIVSINTATILSTGPSDAIDYGNSDDLALGGNPDGVLIPTSVGSNASLGSAAVGPSAPFGPFQAGIDALAAAIVSFTAPAFATSTPVDQMPVALTVEILAVPVDG